MDVTVSTWEKIKTDLRNRNMLGDGDIMWRDTMDWRAE